MPDESKTNQPLKGEPVKAQPPKADPLAEAVALLESASALLEKADGPRPKSYRSIAAQVRALAEKLGAL